MRFAVSRTRLRTGSAAASLLGLIGLSLACTPPGLAPETEPTPPVAPADAPRSAVALSGDPFAALDPVDRTQPRCEWVEAIRIVKHRRRLIALCRNGAALEFPVALGRFAYGHKLRAGDLRTPEGLYRVAEAPRPSPYHIFILLDYPSAVDADRALSEGRVSEAAHARIRSAHARGELPPQETELGGRIGIHGEGSDHQGRSAWRDWTLGCIALSDADVEFLAYRTAVGTPVEIIP